MLRKVLIHNEGDILPICRQFGDVTEPDARLGLVAVQLGQLEDAKRLFDSANRPDLLNKLHQVAIQA